MESLRKMDPLVFDKEVADYFITFERECNVYQAVTLSGKKEENTIIHSAIYLAGACAILKAENHS